MNTGGPAFPTCVSADNEGGLNRGDPGMSLRDWFAGQALVGYLSGPAEDCPNDPFTLAYRAADAMLKAREVKP